MGVERLSGEENRRIYNIDRQKETLNNEAEERRKAEEALMEIILYSLPNVRVERGTEDEDAGVILTDQHSQRIGQQTDLIIFRDEKPWLAVQATTGRSAGVKEKKLRDLKQDPYPIIRGNMVPKILVAVDWTEAQALLADHNPRKHPALQKRFFEGAIHSLELDQMDSVTRDPGKKELAADALVLIIEAQQQTKTKPGATIH